MSATSSESSTNEIRSDIELIDLNIRDNKLLRSLVLQCSLVKVKDDDLPCQSDTASNKHCRAVTWSNHQSAKAPLNVVVLQPGSNCNTIKIEKNTDTDTTCNTSPSKIKPLCIHVPYATTSSTNPIWIQDIMKAKAGTSDG